MEGVAHAPLRAPLYQAGLSQAPEGEMLTHLSRKSASLGGFMQLRQKVGILGALFIACGVFLPVVRVASQAQVTYSGQGNGVMLALALVSFALAARNYCAWLLPTAFTAVAMIITTIRTARSLVPAVGQRAAEPEASLQLDWGLAVLILGTLLLLAAALMKPKPAAGGETAEAHLPPLVLLTTFVLAVVLMGTIWLWPTGTFILQR